MINNKNNRETAPPASPNSKTNAPLGSPGLSDIELVIRYSRALESMLGKHFGATGTGLHERVTSVEKRLSVPLVKRLRWIATMRNNVVHTDGFALPNAAEYEAACKKCLEELGQVEVPAISQSRPETIVGRKLQVSPPLGHDTSLALSLAIAGSAVLTITTLKLLVWLGFGLTVGLVGVVLPVGFGLGPAVVLWRLATRVERRVVNPTARVVNPTARYVSTVADTDAVNRQGISFEPIPGATVAASVTEPSAAESEADMEAGNSVTFFNPSTGLPLMDNCGLDTSGHVVDQNWDYSFGPVDNGGNFNDDFGSV